MGVGGGSQALRRGRRKGRLTTGPSPAFSCRPCATLSLFSPVWRKIEQVYPDVPQTLCKLRALPGWHTGISTPSWAWVTQRSAWSQRARGREEGGEAQARAEAALRRSQEPLKRCLHEAGPPVTFALSPRAVLRVSAPRPALAWPSPHLAVYQASANHLPGQAGGTRPPGRAGAAAFYWGGRPGQAGPPHSPPPPLEMVPAPISIWPM